MSRSLLRALSALLLAGAGALSAGAQAFSAAARTERRAAFSAAGPAAAPVALAAPVSLTALFPAEAPAALSPAPAAAASLHLAAPVASASARAAVPAFRSASAATTLAPQRDSRGAAPDSAAAASKAPGLDASALFDGAAARAALERAARDDYSVTILRRRDGSGSVAVILGEAHEKSERSAAIGSAVLSRFANYAVENYDAKSTWARRYNWSLEKRARERMARKHPVELARGSTIHVASGRAKNDALARHHLLSLDPEARASLLASARAAIAAGRPDGTQLVAGGETLMDAPEIGEILEDLLQGETRRSPPPKRRFNLEAGHRAGFLERIAVWEPAVEKFAPFALAAAALPLLAVRSAPLPAEMIACLAVFLSLTAILLNISFGDDWMALRPGSRAIVLFPFYAGIVRGRDKTMAANLARALESADGPVLAIVGRAHAPGMRARLIARHGFEDAGPEALGK